MRGRFDQQPSDRNAFGKRGKVSLARPVGEGLADGQTTTASAMSTSTLGWVGGAVVAAVLLAFVTSGAGIGGGGLLGGLLGGFLANKLMNNNRGVTPVQPHASAARTAPSAGNQDVRRSGFGSSSRSFSSSGG